MLTRITGTRNGAEWPTAGGIVDLPDHEAEALIGAQVAAPVELELVDDGPAEVATLAAPETPERRRPGRPRKADG